MDQPNEQFDAVIIGSGPNGLAAGVALARGGASVLVLEGASRLGGGADTREVTLPGFRHDICSAAHPMGILSPFFRELPLEEHGLEWIKPGASVAHPLDDRPAGMLWRSLDRTVEELGRDGPRYRALLEPLLANGQGLLKDALGPLRFPEDPVSFVRFGVRAMWPASLLAKTLFREETARALLAGCAGHSILPLSQPMTSALGVLFALTAHLEDWPVAKGGSDAITGALASLLRASGGELRTDHPVASARDLPAAKVYLFDTDPHQLARIAGEALPAGYRKRLQRYRFGPGVFKLDLAMDGPIPWKDPRCSEASTVHVGGTLAEVAASEAAMWRGEHSEKPFVLVVQQSNFDPTRAPRGGATGYAYCHVPANSTVDMTARIESQIERFAPGFRDRIQARHTMTTSDFAAMNLNYVGGAITGGVADLAQLFTRPVARIDPYATPNPRIFICSASTPPGGGVHGMCGWHAAQSAQKQLGKQTFKPFA